MPKPVEFEISSRRHRNSALLKEDGGVHRNTVLRNNKDHMTRLTKKFCRRCSGCRSFLPRKMLEVKPRRPATAGGVARTATTLEQLDDLAANFRAAHIDQASSGLAVAGGDGGETIHWTSSSSSSSSSSSLEQGFCSGHLESGGLLLASSFPTSGPSSPAA